MLSRDIAIAIVVAAIVVAISGAVRWPYRHACLSETPTSLDCAPPFRAYGAPLPFLYKHDGGVWIGQQWIEPNHRRFLLGRAIVDVAAVSAILLLSLRVMRGVSRRLPMR